MRYGKVVKPLEAMARAMGRPLSPTGGRAAGAMRGGMAWMASRMSPDALEASRSLRTARGLGGAMQVASIPFYAMTRPPVYAGRAMTRGAIGAGKFVGRHPKLLFAGAAVAGAIAARPLGPAYEEIVNKEILGQPHATRTMMTSAAVSSLQNQFMTSSQKNFYQGGFSRRWGSGPGNTNYTYPMDYNADFPIRGNLTGPSGDLVFGLYNLRI